ncbi:MAG: hypothetical protein ACRCZS_11465 [Chroococcidiopsis sp.]
MEQLSITAAYLATIAFFGMLTICFGCVGWMAIAGTLEEIRRRR